MRRPLLPHRADHLLPLRRLPPSTTRHPSLPHRATTPLYPGVPLHAPLSQRPAGLPPPHLCSSLLCLWPHTPPATTATRFTGATLVRSPLPTEAVRREIVQQRRGSDISCC